MKAVVFTEEPGMGRAFITTFSDEDEMESYADQNECIVFDYRELDREVKRLRQWVRQAADEYNTAQRRLRHAQDMLDRLYECGEEVFTS